MNENHGMQSTVNNSAENMNHIESIEETNGNSDLNNLMGKNQIIGKALNSVKVNRF